jgi:hypothetical protein
LALVVVAAAARRSLSLVVLAEVQRPELATSRSTASGGCSNRQSATITDSGYGALASVPTADLVARTFPRRALVLPAANTVAAGLVGRA